MSVNRVSQPPVATPPPPAGSGAPLPQGVSSVASPGLLLSTALSPDAAVLAEATALISGGSLEAPITPSNIASQALPEAMLALKSLLGKPTPGTTQQPNAPPPDAVPVEVVAQAVVGVTDELLASGSSSQRLVAVHAVAKDIVKAELATLRPTGQTPTLPPQHAPLIQNLAGLLGPWLKAQMPKPIPRPAKPQETTETPETQSKGTSVSETSAEEFQALASEDTPIDTKELPTLLGNIDLAGVDIESLMWLVFMQIARDAKHDLLDVMKEMQATNAKKQKLRAELAELKAIQAAPGDDSAPPKMPTLTAVQKPTVVAAKPEVVAASSIIPSFSSPAKPQAQPTSTVHQTPTPHAQATAGAIGLHMTGNAGGKKETQDVSGLIDSKQVELDSLSDLTEEKQLNLQRLMDRVQKAHEALSNMLKKISETSSTIVGNMK